MNRPQPSVPSTPRLPLGVRVVVLLSSLLFLAAGGLSAFGLVHCPHHDTSAQAPHALHGPSPDADALHCAPSPGHDTDHDGGCTCVGLCHPAGQASPPTAAPSPAAAAALTLQGAAPPVASAALPAAPAYSFPYATAPPRFAA